MKTCTIKGCDKKHIAKGLCFMHYMRLKRRGITEGTRPYPYKDGLTTIQRSRKRLIDYMGGKCSKCGYSGPALQIDHIKENGNMHRKELKDNRSKLYNAVKNNPENFQLLCANCNAEKYYSYLKFRR